MLRKTISAPIALRPFCSYSICTSAVKGPTISAVGFVENSFLPRVKALAQSATEAGVRLKDDSHQLLVGREVEGAPP